MRPIGSYGDIARALLEAAEHGHAPVRVLAERAVVGYGAAAYTASRLLERGELVVVQPGRPAWLGVPDADTRRGADGAGVTLAQVSAAWAAERGVTSEAEAWDQL